MEDGDQLALMRLALLSLTYVTKETLEDDARATHFYNELLRKTNLSLNRDQEDIIELVKLARLGEIELERRITLAQERLHRAFPC